MTFELPQDDTNIATKEGDLTEAQEHYCQLRATGYTKTKAAALAYNSKYPGQIGWELEQQDKIKERINELRSDRAEAFGLTQEEQVRKYHDIYQEAYSKGQLGTAMKALERLDAIGGFEAAKKTLVHKVNRLEIFKDESDNLQSALQRFSSILEKPKDPIVVDTSDESMVS